jgi:PKD repeat protein
MQGLQPRLFLLFTLALAAAGSRAQGPMQGARDLGAERPGFALSASRYLGLETARIHAPGASYVKVHFAELRLPDGVSVEIGNSDGTETYRYDNAGFDPLTLDRQRGDDGVSRFYAMSITGDSAVVRLTGAVQRFDPARHSVVIDTWLAGPDPSSRPARATAKGAADDVSQLETTCGVNERYDARCYADSHPAAYDRSIPVALLITSSGEECTAWRVGSGNRLFTAEHCISGQADLDGAEIWFQYRTESCGGSATAEPVKVTGGELLARDDTLDYALFTVDDFDSIAYLGHLGLDVREGARGEGIFIPQHGLGRPKQIAMESDMNSSGWCEIDDDDYSGYGPGTDIGYFCDTTTSSSGSPVLSSLTGKVIALHHLGGCFNSGSKISLIWPQVKAHFGNSVPQGDGEVPWGAGNQVPDAHFQATCTGLACGFDGSGSGDDGSIDSWDWDFGDGAGAAGTPVEHEFAAAGSYTVRLTVRDDQGATDAYSKSITVSLPNVRPEAAFSTQCQYNVCQFNGSGSSDADGSIVSWSWTFGDGSTASGAQISHQYAAAGTYPISLTVTDDAGAADTRSYSAVISLPNQKPSASFTLSCSDLACSVDAAASSDPDGRIDAWQWYFGDGATASGAAVSHTYPAPDQYTITLTVTDDHGATAAASQTANATAAEPPPATDPQPVAEFTVNCLDRSCTLDAGSSVAGDGAIANYDWAFGDGVTGKGEKVTHEYVKDGRYRVTLKVTGGDQTSATRSRTIQVESERAIDLRATGGRPNGRAIAMLTWTNAGTDTVLIRRNGQQIAEVPDTGKYIDTGLTTLRKSATYQVCEAGGANCSEEIVVMLGPIWGLKAPEDKLPPAKLRR